MGTKYFLTGQLLHIVCESHVEVLGTYKWSLNCTLQLVPYSYFEVVVCSRESFEAEVKTKKT